jgi:hypothetical protein
MRFCAILNHLSKRGRCSWGADNVGRAAQRAACCPAAVPQLGRNEGIRHCRLRPLGVAGLWTPGAPRRHWRTAAPARSIEYLYKCALVGEFSCHYVRRGGTVMGGGRQLRSPGCRAGALGLCCAMQSSALRTTASAPNMTHCNQGRSGAAAATPVLTMPNTVTDSRKRSTVTGDMFCACDEMRWPRGRTPSIDLIQWSVD